MSVSQDDSVPIIDSILHPSDFSAASEVAFAHALKGVALLDTCWGLLGRCKDEVLNTISASLHCSAAAQSLNRSTL
jgi:hypothetical protein